VRGRAVLDSGGGVGVGDVRALRSWGVRVRSGIQRVHAVRRRAVFDVARGDRARRVHVVRVRRLRVGAGGVVCRRMQRVRGRAVLDSGGGVGVGDVRALRSWGVRVRSGIQRVHAVRRRAVLDAEQRHRVGCLRGVLCGNVCVGPRTFSL
jgi:hypothetical protein